MGIGLGVCSNVEPLAPGKMIVMLKGFNEEVPKGYVTVNHADSERLCVDVDFEGNGCEVYIVHTGKTNASGETPIRQESIGRLDRKNPIYPRSWTDARKEVVAGLIGLANREREV
jgi:hypothetical protein